MNVRRLFVQVTLLMACNWTFLSLKPAASSVYTYIYIYIYIFFFFGEVSAHILNIDAITAQDVPKILQTELSKFIATQKKKNDAVHLFVQYLN